MSDTATLAVWDAIDAVIRAGQSEPLTQLGNPILGPKRVYWGDAPPNAALGYVLFGTAPEDDLGFRNGQDGEAAEFTIHCWADTLPNANRLFRWVKGLLETKPAVTGFTVIEWEIRKGSEAPDAESTAWQVPMYLRVETLDA